MENIDQSIYERADEGEKLGVEKGRKDGIEEGENSTIKMLVKMDFLFPKLLNV